MAISKEEGTQAEHWQTWYEQFDNNYGPEERSHWYSNAAKAYHWARPRYPDSLLDQALSQANLVRTDQSTTETSEPSSILEIGCGPGIATAALAERGFRVQAVEPSAAACELARQSCQTYPEVSVYNSTFEDYPLAGQTFDAVVAATSFHWVSPAIACKKSAAALKPNGSLILLWATPPQPSKSICDLLQTVYDALDLSELGEQQYRTQAYYQHNFETFARTVADSGLFLPTPVTTQEHHSTYSVEKYLALLSTLSPYIALENKIRTELFESIEKKLSNQPELVQSSTLELTHWFAIQVAPLKIAL